MIDYKIVVPTYQRYTFVKEKTLSFLERQNIPKENIYIFVANKEEEKKYLEELRGYKIIVGRKGINLWIYIPKKQRVDKKNRAW